MADALAGITAAIECVSLCIKAISVLRNFSASVKDAENELASIIHLVEKARNRVELIKVILLELRGANYPGVAAGFLGASDNLKLTLGDIMLLTSNVVSGESRLGIAKRIKWVMNKSKAQGLIKRLQSQERDIAQEFTLVNSLTSLRTQRQIDRLARASERTSEICVAFADISISSGGTTSEAPGAMVMPRAQKGRVHSWLGIIFSDLLPLSYVQARHSLSEAAYLGDWDEVSNALDTGIRVYGESWSNAPRLQFKEDRARLSMWTPLHQAVYHHASVEVVQMLLGHGAFKTLRTKKSHFSYPDMTPLELARDMGVAHLYDILSPVVRQTTPAEVLKNLERSFHQLIRSECGQRVDLDALRLPLLEPLTELDGEAMWFSLVFGGDAGYLYQLIGRELQIKSVHVLGFDDETLYRVTEDAILEMDEIINFSGPTLVDEEKA